MSSLKTLSLVAIILSMAAPCARAESEDRFVEACDSGAWDEAEKAWAALDGEQPVALVLQHANVLVHLGRKDEAQKAAESVRERDPGNVLALSLLARLAAPGSPEAAKTLLLEAAREGYYVLREVRATKELRSLGDDPKFVLAVMKTQNERRSDDQTHRNPFAHPSMSPTGAIEPKKPAVVTPTVKEPAKRLEEYVTRANMLLRTLSRLLREEKLQEMRGPYEDVKTLVFAMRHETDEDFLRTADLIFERASRLELQAERLRKIKALEIEITGIVVTKDVPSKAIVSLGTASGIYGIGDEVKDATGRSSGLKVKAIQEGLVSFQYEELEFRRELRHAK